MSVDIWSQVTSLKMPISVCAAIRGEAQRRQLKGDDVISRCPVLPPGEYEPHLAGRPLSMGLVKPKAHRANWPSFESCLTISCLS